jgi:hypothetical protein
LRSEASLPDPDRQPEFSNLSPAEPGLGIVADRGENGGLAAVRGRGTGRGRWPPAANEKLGSGIGFRARTAVALEGIGPDRGLADASVGVGDAVPAIGLACEPA